MSICFENFTLSPTRLKTFKIKNFMESITLEQRPRLRSLNAYISLKSSIDPALIRVKLLENSIEIRIDAEVFELPLSPINILPSSLSFLRITNHWISFRIQTKPNSIFGTFSTEILGTDKEASHKVPEQSNERLPPKNVKCSVLCACCENEITRAICFERILPLPHEDNDPSEWFCCKHNGNSFEKLLHPKEADYLYGPHHFILHETAYTSSLKIKNRNIHCGRCLTVIGIINKGLFNIWNCCAEYKLIDEKKILHAAPDPLMDFISLVKDSAQACIGEVMLVETLAENSSQYILLKPMELKLNLLVKENCNDKEKVIDFRKICVTKVLYKYGSSNESVRFKFPEAKYSEMARPSIMAAMDHLLTSTGRFPPAYRKTDDYYIGYVETEGSNEKHIPVGNGTEHNSK